MDMSIPRLALTLAITISANLLAAACSGSVTPDPQPTDMSTAVTMPSSGQSDTNLTEEVIAPAISNPVIFSVTFPESILSGVEYGNGVVAFKDHEGDVHSAQFTLLEGGCMEFEYFAFDPMQAIQAGNRFDGIFQFRQMCQKCAGSEGDMLLMQVQLFDRESNASEPALYQFVCE